MKLCMMSFLHLRERNLKNYKGAEDTWLVNYQDCKFYMHDGATEYVTDMFKDEYLAVWLMAIEDYYGVKL